MSLIIVREAGKEIPKAFMDILFAKLILSVSSSYVDGDNDIASGARAVTKEEPYTAEDLVADVNDAKDFSTVHVFNADEIPEECYQPFDVLMTNTKAGITVLVQAFLDGDFTAHAAKDGKTDEYNAFHKKIQPILAEVYESGNKSGKGLEHLIASVEGDAVKNRLFNEMGEFGTITLVVKGHKPITIEKGESIGSQFPWGWVNDTLHYKEEAPPAPAPVKKRGLLGRTNLSSTTAPAPQPDPKLPAKPTPGNKEGPTETDDEDQTGDQAAAEAEFREQNPDREMITPPKGIQGKELRTWYNKNCEWVPHDFYKRPAAPAKKVPLKSMDQLKKPTDGAKIDTDGDISHLPLLTPAAIKKIQSFVTLDRQAKAMPDDPKQFQALEGKIATFCDQIGQENEKAYDGWDYEIFLDFVKLSPEGAAILLRDYLFRARVAEHDVEMLTAPAAEGTQPKGEASAAVPEAKAPKRGLLARRS